MMGERIAQLKREVTVPKRSVVVVKFIDLPSEYILYISFVS